MISQEQLKVLFDYRDGELVWKVACRYGLVGKSAGYLSYSSALRPLKGPYHVIRIKRKGYKRSQLVYAWHTGEGPKGIDHKNRVSFDDRFENLRPATREQNGANVLRPSINKKAGLPRGVRRVDNKFDARVGGRSLGRFNTAEEAEFAYKYAHVEEYGEFSPYVNDVIAW